MKILLIPAINIVNKRLTPYFPYGLLLLQAISSETDGVTIDIACLNKDITIETFFNTDHVVDFFTKNIDFSGYDVYGFSCICDSFHYSLDIACILKQKYPKSLVVMGGPYVAKTGEKILSFFNFIDAVFIGESEFSFRMFIKNKLNKKHPFLGVPGVLSRDSVFLPTEKIRNIDLLPSAVKSGLFFSYIDMMRNIEKGFPIPLEYTRGCPLVCSFCSTRQTWGSVVRRKSDKKIVEEMLFVKKKTKDNFFSLIGDNVGVPKRDFMEFCDNIVRNQEQIDNQFTWGVSLKLDKFNKNDLEKLWIAGCRGMFIGVESASQKTLDNVNKKTTLEKEINSIKIAIEMGFKIETSFIIGFPWETENDIKKTYELHCDLLRIGARRSQVVVLCPIPGTEIVEKQKISFGESKSNLNRDNIILSNRHANLIKCYPELFSNFGYYETPNVSRRVIKAYRDAAAQVCAYYTNKN